MTAAVTSTDSASAGAPASFDFAAYLEAARQQVEAALDGSLGPERPESLREAMRYSLQGLRSAWKVESSFRMEVYVCSVLAPLAFPAEAQRPVARVARSRTRRAP
jgi:hypothetical protein